MLLLPPYLEDAALGCNGAMVAEYFVHLVLMSMHLMAVMLADGHCSIMCVCAGGSFFCLLCGQDFVVWVLNGYSTMSWRAHTSVVVKAPRLLLQGRQGTLCPKTSSKTP